MGASLAFAILSQMVEYRFFHVSVSGIYEVSIFQFVNSIQEILEAMGLFVLCRIMRNISTDNFTASCNSAFNFPT